MSRDRFVGIILILAAVVIGMGGYILNDLISDRSMASAMQVPGDQVPGVTGGDSVPVPAGPTVPIPTGPVPIKAAPVVQAPPAPRTTPAPASVPTAPAATVPRAATAPVTPAPAAPAASAPTSRTFSIEISTPDGAKVYLLRRGWDYAREGKKFVLSSGEFWVNANLFGTWANELQYDVLVNGVVLRTISNGPNKTREFPDGAPALWFRITDSGELVTVPAPVPTVPAPTAPTPAPAVTPTTPVPAASPTRTPAPTTPAPTTPAPATAPAPATTPAPAEDVSPEATSSVAQPEEERSVWATNALFTFGKKK